MKITKGTLVRTIMLVIVLINMVLKHFGIELINVDENTILEIIEALIEIAVIIVSFWKNNSFTANAIKADEFLQKLRESEVK